MNLIKRAKVAASLAIQQFRAEEEQVAISRKGYADVVEKSLNIGNATDVDQLLSGALGGFIDPGYNILASDGYMRNHIVSHIINDISRKCAHVKLKSEDPEVQAFLDNPANNMSQSEWINRMMIHKLIDGVAPAEIITMGNRIKWMMPIRPDKVEPWIGNCDVLLGYIITNCGQRFIKLDFTGKSESLTDMFYWRYYHPLREHYGLSRLVAVWDSIIQNNEISEIHKTVLANDGAPKGFISMENSSDPDEPEPGDDQMSDIRSQVNEKLGPKNRGFWAVFPRAFKFIRMAATGKEMDWAKVKQDTAREIALGLDYPPMLLGFAEGATFNNVSEALRELWTGTIIPEVESLAEEIEQAWERNTGKKVEVEADTKEILAIIEILEERREALRKDAAAGIISQKEARIGGKYPETPEGSGHTFFVPTSVTPVTDVSVNTDPGV